MSVNKNMLKTNTKRDIYDKVFRSRLRDPEVRVQGKSWHYSIYLEVYLWDYSMFLCGLLMESVYYHWSLRVISRTGMDYSEDV